MHYNGVGANGAAGPEPYKILVIGGSYAGLAISLNLLDLCHGRPCRFDREPETFEAVERIPVQITIVDERDGYYHLIGTPLSFASEEYAAKTWVKYADIPALQSPEINVLQGSVTDVDCGTKSCVIRETGSQHHIQENYDFLVACSGLRRTWPSAPRSLSREKYIAETTMHIDQAKNAEDGVVVIGGGAVGIEIAAELKHAQLQQKVTLIHSRPKLLSSEPLPGELSDRILSILDDAGIETILSSRVAQTSPYSQGDGNISSRSTITLTDGRKIQAGYVIDGISRSSPTSTYLPGAAVNKEGLVKVNDRLNFPPDVANSQYHFAAGDIALWAGIKRAGGAMHQGHYAAVNVHQQMLSERFGNTPQFVEIQKHPPTICLAIGESAAGYSADTGVFSGRDVQELYFRNDLGFEICWNHMRLGEQTNV